MKPVLALAVLIAALAIPTATAGAGGSDAKVVCVTFANNGDTRIGLKSEPRNCSFLHRGSEPIGANLVDMVKLDWKNWGSKKAKGTGKFLVNMSGPLPGRVVLSKPSSECVGKPVYTKATLIYPQDNARTNMRLDPC